MRRCILMVGPTMLIGKQTTKRHFEKSIRSSKIHFDTRKKDLESRNLLKDDLSGFWSQRITAEHRLVYVFDDDSVTIFQFKGHNE